jgi:hypothetical protein
MLYVEEALGRTVTVKGEQQATEAPQRSKS